MGKGETLMPAGARPFRSGTKNPMGKDRVRDRKINKQLSQMMESRNKKPSKPIYFEKDRLKKMVKKELNKTPMGKDRVRDRKIKKLSQMMERRESLRKNTKPILPPRSRGTGGVNRGGFRKPDTSRIRPGILSNRKKVNKAG